MGVAHLFRALDGYSCPDARRGAFIDLLRAILLLGPIFVTIAQNVGLDFVQLGLMMVVDLAVGLYMPPVGTTLFVSTTISGTRISETVMPSSRSMRLRSWFSV